MAELFNYTNGIRGARVDPLLSQNQNKKVVPEARARRNSFSSKENSIIAAEDSTTTIGRKKLTTEFEKTHANGKNQAMETRRKSNPDAYLKQTTQERVSLGKKMNGELAGRGLNTAAANCVTLKPADLQQESTVRNINKSSSDHFQKSSMVPAEGASPKKAGLRFMAGPPEFVADPYVPKKLHTHAVAGARGKDSSMGGLIKQQDNSNNFSVASSAATSTTASVARRNSFTSSASYNIITGQ